MTDALNKIVNEGLDVNIVVPARSWIGLGLAVALPGVMIIMTAYTFKNLK